MKGVRILLVSIAAATAVVAEEKPPPRVEPSAAAPLGQVLEWTSAEGKPYWYRLPRKIDRQKPPNLLVMLHGTGLKWGWAFWNYPIAAGGFRGNDIVVAPEGMTPGQGDTFNFIQGKEDGRQIAGLIAAFKRAFPIERVYLYGHSQGAFFTYWFAGEYPELVDGIVAHAGNVLDVKHSKLAKEKVAIAILHGKADAVVPVDCAYRTEKIYSEQGYKNVKLLVVEGLTPESGHWPLPKQAAQMLEWLDSVSPARPLAVEIALSELGKGEPDLEVVVEAAGRGDLLLKAYKGADKSALVERLKAVRALLDEVQSAHAEALKSPDGKARKDSEYGPWAKHFRVAEESLGRLPSWQKSAKPLRARAQGHDKILAAILPRLDHAGEKEFAEGIKAAETAFLANRYEPLLALLENVAAKSPSPVKPADAEKLKALIQRRKSPDEEGLRAASGKTRELAQKFRKEHAAWFEGKGDE